MRSLFHPYQWIVKTDQWSWKSYSNWNIQKGQEWINVFITLYSFSFFYNTHAQKGDNMTEFPLTIDVLGDILEGSSKNPNGELYGSIHNMGHDFISKALNPKAVNFH